MKIFVTGATGVIGWELAKALAAQQHEVIAYSRRIPENLRCSGVYWVKGELSQQQRMAYHMQECQQVYHVAALARLHAKDPAEFFTTNVQGTTNVLQAARDAGVNRVCFTSTCGILGPSNGKALSELDVHTGPFQSNYDLSKFIAEQKVLDYVMKGLDVVTVNVSRVFGPSQLRHSNAITRLMKNALAWPIMLIPGSRHIIHNYGYIPDVVAGHINAMAFGTTGERYLLGGHNLSYQEIFELISAIKGRNIQLLPLSKTVMKCFALLETARAGIMGDAPAAKVVDIKRFAESRPLDLSKAISEIKYRITPIAEAIDETIQFLRQSDQYKNHQVLMAAT